MMSFIARTVSSIGVSGSERWQYSTSTKSSPNRSSEPSTACIRYLRLSVLFMFGVPLCSPQKTFVVTTYDQRGHPSSRSTSPMIVSLLPPAYASALSKKLQPASPAAAMQSRARLLSSWVSKVTQLPNDSTLTLSPVLPRRRYSMLGFTAGVAMSATLPSDRVVNRIGSDDAGGDVGAVGPDRSGPVDQSGLMPAARSRAICSSIRSSTGPLTARTVRA